MKGPEALVYFLELNRFKKNSEPGTLVLSDANHLILIDEHQLNDLEKSNISFSDNMNCLLFEIQNINFYKFQKQQTQMVYKPRNLKTCSNPHCTKELTDFRDNWQVFYIKCSYKHIETKIGIASCEDEFCMEMCQNRMSELNEILIQKST